MELQVLEYKKVLKKVREGFDKGVLLCQQPEFTPNSGCVYENDSGAKCAIGYCLEAPVLFNVKERELNEGASFNDLVHHKMVGYKGIKSKFERLQVAHDHGPESLKNFLDDEELRLKEEVKE